MNQIEIEPIRVINNLRLQLNEAQYQIALLVSELEILREKIANKGENNEDGEKRVVND